MEKYKEGPLAGATRKVTELGVNVIPGHTFDYVQSSWSSRAHLTIRIWMKDQQT